MQPKLWKNKIYCS